MAAQSVYKKLVLLLAIVMSASPVFSTEADKKNSTVPQEARRLDKSKYISIDEVRPGMNAWCLTVYEGTKIEKFGLEVISVVRDYEPGRDAIIVKGTDPRFIYTGPVAGCSGSPVYIEGRLAGALAFGWSFSKDALYGVTPIADMLKAGEAATTQRKEGENLSAWNFANPLDLTAAADAFTRPKPAAQAAPSGASALPMVLSTSQLPAGVAEQLTAACSPLGFVAATGLSGTSADPNLAKNTNLEPGSVAVVPLVDGDIKVTALGTVTDVVGDRVYAFGHSFLGYGETDMPLATGKVDTVVTTLTRSFKIGAPLEVRGALTSDEATAVVGTIGKKATTIPLVMKIDRYNDTGIKTYHCRIISNEQLSPSMLMTAVSAATQM